MQRATSTVLAGKNYTSSSIPPTSPLQGDYWDEIDGSGNPIQWSWNGTVWLSRNLYQQNILAISGQGIVLGGTVGIVSGTTDNTPFYQGNDYDLFLTKIHGIFRVPAGNLSATNYWTLQFRDTNYALQSLNITAGNGGETTGYVAKSAVINTKYSKISQGFYNIVFAKNGSAPNIYTPAVVVEYRLAR